jgi:hypothetical protein
MRVCIAAALIACLAIAGISGCSGSGQSCSVEDYGGAGAGGFATPQQALRSVLATHPTWLSVHGYVAAERTDHGVTFRSGDDSVDVVKSSGGRWVIGGVTACQ